MSKVEVHILALSSCVPVHQRYNLVREWTEGSMLNGTGREFMS